jgi:hypothetical protein
VEALTLVYIFYIAALALIIGVPLWLAVQKGEEDD